MSSRQRPFRFSANSVTVLLLGLGSATGGYAWHWYKTRASRSQQAQVITAQVCSAPFDHIIIEQGELESSRNVDIVVEVESRGKQGTQILWVIDEGSHAEQGDLLVQLDSSALEEDLKRQRVIVTNAEAALIRSESDLRTAEISLKQYLNGTYLTERRTILSQIALAQQRLRVAELGLESVRRLAIKGAVAELQIESEQYTVTNAKNVLDDANARLKVLDKLTREKYRIQLESDIDACEAMFRSDGSVLREQQLLLDQIEDQISKCSITAPTDGVVVYNNLTGKRAKIEFIVEEGAFVRQRQAILKLPDPEHMRVKAHINETRIMSVKEGMAARVKADAVPDQMIGKVTTVKSYAKRDRYDSYVRDYATYIEIIDPPETIRVGMTAEVQIFAEHLPTALQIPVQSVYQYQGHLFCLRKLGRDEWETVEVQIGATNDMTAVVESGLAEADFIAHHPHPHRDLFNFPELDEIPEREILREIGRNVGSVTQLPANKDVDERRRSLGKESADNRLAPQSAKRVNKKKDSAGPQAE